MVGAGGEYCFRIMRCTKASWVTRARTAPESAEWAEAQIHGGAGTRLLKNVTCITAAIERMAGVYRPPKKPRKDACARPIDSGMCRDTSGKGIGPNLVFQSINRRCVPKRNKMSSRLNPTSIRWAVRGGRIPPRPMIYGGQGQDLF